MKKAIIILAPPNNGVGAAWSFLPAGISSILNLKANRLNTGTDAKEIKNETIKLINILLPAKNVSITITTLLK